MALSQVATRIVCGAFFIVLIIISGPSGEAGAQTLIDGGRIEAIRIDGAQRIEPATVRSYMRINPGEEFDPVKLDDSLKSIFRTGLFADVTLSREGGVLVVRVVENPIISQVAFEGNQRIEDETLENEVQLRSRLVFTRAKAQQDTLRILDVYRRAGRFAATVEPKVIQLDQNRVNVVFEIDEGPPTLLRSINFIGNRAFSDSDLRDEIASAEYSFWNFLTTTDTYDPDRLAFDQDLMRRFYRNEGYADFTVLSAVAELTEDREGFIVTFTVEEGELYEFGSLDFDTTLRNLDPESLRQFVTFAEGERYNASEVETTANAVADFLGDQGFAFVEANPIVDRDAENRRINLTLKIEEGEKVFIERIEIEGNIRTVEEVIRREFLLSEGDAFNVTKLRRSRERIQRLGFFATVDLEERQGSQPDRAIVKATVEEQSTGNLSFGIGVSSATGPIGQIGIQERNLLGRGQDLRASFRLAGAESQIRIGFTEPYFLDREISAGFDVFRISQDRDESDFELERIGGGVRFGYTVAPNIRHVVRYTAAYSDTKGIDSDTSAVIQAEEGKDIRSTLGSEFRYDTTDSRFDPRRGISGSLRTDFGGLGGDVRFVKTEVDVAWFYTVEDDWTVSLRGGLGKVTGIADDVSVQERFFKGAPDPRGFEFGGIGPRDATNGDALGGENFYTGTAELSFPLGLPQDIDIRGRLFTDVGAVWEVDDFGTGTPIEDSSAPRIAVGAGFSWNSPLGPFIVDFGFPLVDKSFDETEILSFSFGTQF